MKKIILIMLLGIFPSVLFAQIQVEAIVESPMDLTASTQKRVDLNGAGCALVKVEMKSPQAQFQGNVVGDVAYNTSEYLVYVSPGTKILKMLHPEQNPIIIDFSKYGIESLKSERTYTVKIHIPSNINIIDLQELIKRGHNAYSEENYTEAYSLFSKAADYNSPEAMFMLSIMVVNGRGVAKNEEIGYNWCRRSAELGYPAAQYNLGVNYFEGNGVLKDYKEGVVWFTKSALQGFHHSMHNLGIAYEFGYGVEINLDEAEYWFCKAINNGNESSPGALERVQKKIVSPESDFKHLSLFCVKGNITYCFSPDVWGTIPESKKKYYDPVGIFIDAGGSPFIFSMKDEDREITREDAKNKYGNYLLTEPQAEVIKAICEELIVNCKKLGVNIPTGAYWIKTSNSTPKGLIFADDEKHAFILNLTENSVAAVRPIINFE